MLGRILELVDANGNRNALCISGSYTSYARFVKRIADIQNFLDLKFPEEKSFAIEATDTVDTYAAIMALLFSGKAYIPLHPQNPASRNLNICRLAGTKTVLLSEQDLLKIESDDLSLLALDTIPESSSLKPVLRAEADDLAYILFTSGSTGLPKGVPITHANLHAFVQGFENLGLHVNHEDRVLQMFDLTFDLSVMSYLIPFLNGACVYTVPEAGIKFMSVYELLEEEKITVALMVPSVVNYLRPYFSDVSLPSLRYSLFCGEALPFETAELWQACVPGAKVLNVYGPTEATIFCTAAELGAAGNYNGICGIGTAMSELSYLIVDEVLNPVAAGEKGELCLTGAQISPGYLHNEEKNREAFFMHKGIRYYRSGDIAFSNEQGQLFYCGRLDQQVKVMGGYRVELAEIEHHARSFSGSSFTVAIAVPHPSGSSQIHLFIPSGINAAELRDHLALKLPSYMMPSAIIDIPEFPLNSNGKTDRRILAEKALSLQLQNP